MPVCLGMAAFNGGRERRILPALPRFRLRTAPAAPSTDTTHFSIYVLRDGGDSPGGPNKRPSHVRCLARPGVATKMVVALRQRSAHRGHFAHPHPKADVSRRCQFGLRASHSLSFDRASLLSQISAALAHDEQRQRSRPRRKEPTSLRLGLSFVMSSTLACTPRALARDKDHQRREDER
jgi:hypothetical protein